MTPSNYPARFLASVSSRLKQEGVRSSLEDDVLVLPELNCRVRCELLEGDFDPRLVPFRVLTEHPAFGAPIEDQIAAIATTPDAAVRYATDLWGSAFFYPFRAFVQASVKDQPLVMVTTSPSGELLGWQIFTTAPFTNAASAPNRMELLQPLITPLNSVLLDRNAHSLKCFIQKEAGEGEPEDLITGSCHFDNEEWVDGLSELLYVAVEWGTLRSPRIMRQWCFFRPASKAELGTAWDKITAAMK